jgi:GNAT superfamily N-acetyltransferase
MALVNRASRPVVAAGGLRAVPVDQVGRDLSLRGDIHSVVVSDEVRGAGIGAKLLEAVRSDLLARGIECWSIGCWRTISKLSACTDGWALNRGANRYWD